MDDGTPARTSLPADVAEAALQPVLHLRYPATQWAVAVGGTVEGLLMLALSSGALTDGAYAGSVILASTAFGGLWCLVRAPFLGAVLDDEGVLCRNVLTSQRARWGGIEAAGFQRVPGFRGRQDALVVRSSGGGTLKIRYVHPRDLAKFTAFWAARAGTAPRIA
jgi:hypothetical protein